MGLKIRKIIAKEVGLLREVKNGLCLIANGLEPGLTLTIDKLPHLVSGTDQ